MGLAGNIDGIGCHMRELRTVDDRGERVAGFGTGVLREGDKWECMQILGELGRTNSLYFDRASQIKMEGWSKGRVDLVGDNAACILFVANGRTRLSPSNNSGIGAGRGAGQDRWRAPGRLSRT